MSSRPVDWKALAQELGVLHDGQEGTSVDDYRRALELLVGEEVIRSGVDHYVAGGQGMDLVAGVLSRIRPRSAMERCYQIFNSNADIETRRSAIDLMRMVADRSALAWVPEFLADPDQGVQNWGIEVVEQLLWTGTIDESEGGPFLREAERHPSEHVRKVVERTREMLRKRWDRDREPSEST